VEIVVKGRHSELPMGFREHTEDKVARLERLDHRVIRLDVEVLRERNPRQSDICERVELTCIGKGPLVRAEAAAPDPYAALDMALDKLEERLRRAATRRHSRGARTHGKDKLTSALLDSLPHRDGIVDPESTFADAPDPATVLEDGPLVVREKRHEGPPMTVEDALHHMELVGHDFFLFSDADTGECSVVYRRKGYNYGLLRLAVTRDQ
jgi:ribosomal subunit interface protein